MNGVGVAPTALVGSIQKFSVDDGPGIRTTVFLKGCPLRCRWCHNPELIEPGQQLMQSRSKCIGCACCVGACPKGAISVGPDGVQVDRAPCDACLACTQACYARALRPAARPMTVGQVMSEVAKDAGFYENTGGGLTISGGELLAHVDFASALVDAAAAQGIGVCLDTCGQGSGDALLDLAARSNVTHVLFDVKAADDAVHRACTGVSNAKILSNLRLLAGDSRTAGKLVARMPLVAGLNDGDALIQAAGGLFREIGVKHVDLLPYHPLGVGKMRNAGGVQERFEAPSDARLEQIAAYFRGIGLEAVLPGRS